MARPTDQELTIERKARYTHKSQEKGHVIPQDTQGSIRVGQKAEGVRGEVWVTALLWFLWERIVEAG